MVIGASRDPHIPDFPDESEEVRRKKALKYYQDHYFDMIDLNRPALLRTPFIHEKVMNYFDNYISQEPDSLIQAIDKFFEDRKSTRLNSSHVATSYAVFCLKIKKYTSTIRYC